MMMNKLCYKRLVVNLLLISFTGSSIIGCNGNSAGSSANSVSSFKQYASGTAKISSTSNGFDGVAANTIQHDSTKQSSYLSLVTNNNSNWTFTFLGCDNSKVGAFNSKSINIDANYQFPTTTNYADKWVDLGFPLQANGQKTPIPSSEHIFEKAIWFNEPDSLDLTKGYEASCFYKLTNPTIGTDHPMFIKLAFKWKSECVSQQVCGQTTATKIRELNDKKREGLGWWYATWGIEGVSVPGLSLISAMSYQKLRPMPVPINDVFEDYFQQSFYEYNKYIDKLSQKMAEFKDMPPEAFAKDLEAFKDSLTSEQKIAFDDMALDMYVEHGQVGYLLSEGGANPEEVIKQFLGDYKTASAEIAPFDTGNSTTMMRKFVNRQTGEVEIVGRDMTHGRLYHMGGVTTAESDKRAVMDGLFGIEPPKNFMEYFDDKYGSAGAFKKVGLEENVLTAEEKKVLEERFPANYYEGYKSDATEAIEASMRQPITIFEERAFKDIAFDAAASTGIGIAIIAGMDMLMSFGLKAIGGSPALGLEDYSPNLFSLAEVTEADVANNQDKQLQANTKVTLVGGADLTTQTVMLTPIFMKAGNANSSVDLQTNVQIAINSLSTPAQRYEPYDPFGSNEDPFFGSCMGKQNCGKTPTHKSDAAIMMNITAASSSSLQTHDVNFLLSQAAGSITGIDILSKAQPLDAPIVTVNSVSDTNHKKLSSGLRRVGNIEGLFLNHDQSAELTVQLPKALGSNGDDELYGGGLFADLISEEDEMEPGDDAPVSHSMVHFTKAQSTSAEKAASDSGSYVFTNMFDCPAPLKLGSTCKLNIKLSGKNDGKKHIGHLLVADATSFVRYLTVYINYNIITDYNIVNGNIGDDSPQPLELKNVSGRTYERFEVDGLPEGASIDNSNCSNVSSGNSCTLWFNLGNVVDDGSYYVKVYGVTADNRDKPLSELPRMDKVNIEVQVMNDIPWKKKMGVKNVSK
jgi:hypothetical protein